MSIVGAATPQLQANIGRAPCTRTARAGGPARPLLPCRSACGSCARCRAHDEAADRAADSWARERGAEIPREIDTARFLGDRWPTSRMLEAFSRRKEERMALAVELEVLDQRIAIVKAATVSAERQLRALERRRRAVRRVLDGATGAEVAAELGIARPTAVGLVHDDQVLAASAVAALPSLRLETARHISAAAHAAGIPWPTAGLQLEITFPPPPAASGGKS
jgi:hypothetical protein